MKSAFFALGVLVFGCSVASAEVRLEREAVSVSTPGGIDGLIRQVRREVAGRIIKNIDRDTSGMDQYVDCAPVKEVPGGFICNSFFQATMNDTFTRMGFFMGASKGFQPGMVVAEDNVELVNYKKIVAGHNLPGQVVLDFYAKVAPLNAREADLRDGFLRQPAIAALGPAFYLIGTSSQNNKSAKDVVSHEIYHAQYGLVRSYRETVNRFWKEAITPEDQRAIRETLGQAYNDIDEIVIDECQAYLLQANADKDLLRAFSKAYSEKLRAALTAAGAAPVTVN